MTLHLYYHPLSSFCHKVLVAFYENDIPFEPHIVDFSDRQSREAFFALWPAGKMPVLRDEAKGRTIPESSILIEYLQQNYPGPVDLLPADPDQALRVRLADRFFDLHVHVPMQKIITDRLRPQGGGDPYGVDHATRQIATSYDMIEADLAGRFWAAGDDFSMADCAAAPALFYAEKVAPFGDGRPRLSAYYERLMRRPSYARVIAEAQPYFDMFPG